MQIVVWQNFSKRRNSTKRPGSSSGTSVNVALKENTSVENPTFVLSGNDFTINYVQAFGNYYFVDDVVSVANGRIEVICSLDSMATHKSTIGSYYAFVERSFSQIDQMIPDPNVAMLNNTYVSTSFLSTPSILAAAGFYAVSVLNDRGSGAGFTCTYFMDYDNLKALAQYCNTDWGSSATDFLDWIQANFLHTADAIIDCVWLPVSISGILTGATAYENVKIGTDIVNGVYGYRVLTTSVVASDSDVYTIPHYYSDFRKAAPYSTGKLYLPIFGVIDFNPVDFPDDNIYIQYNLDICTGDMTVLLSNGNGALVATYMYNVAVTCPVGKVSQNLTGTAGSLLTTVGAAVATAFSGGTAALIAGGITTGASAINTLANAVTPLTSYRGSKGGRSAAYNSQPRIAILARETSDPAWFISTHGRPLMQQKQISSLSGFIKCSGASVPISGHPREKQEVDDYLNSGFYYE